VLFIDLESALFQTTKFDLKMISFGKLKKVILMVIKALVVKFHMKG
jgi:hypothetical protein